MIGGLYLVNLSGPVLFMCVVKEYRTFLFITLRS
jgi:hypothetical protein